MFSHLFYYKKST